MAQTQLYYVGTSAVLEIRSGGDVSFGWGSYGDWTNFKTPPKAAEIKKVTYKKATKDAPGAEAYAGMGGVTKFGTSIPATITKRIDGVDRTIRVRYYVRGYTKYTRTAALKEKKKMQRSKWNNTTAPLQYRLQYEDSMKIDRSYSSYSDGMNFVYFANEYQNDSNQMVPTASHLLHPIQCDVQYSDVRRNFESSTNNSDGRDNAGSYVLSNVRVNVVTIDLKWAGLSSEDGAILLAVLCPEKSNKGSYPYLTVQYLDPATNKIKNGTFFAAARKCTKYPSGAFKEISVSLTEV